MFKQQCVVALLFFLKAIPQGVECVQSELNEDFDNSSLASHISTNSNNVSDVQFSIKPRSILIRRRRKGDRKRGKFGDSSSEEDYDSSSEEYSRSCRKCRPKKAVVLEALRPTPPPPPTPPTPPTPIKYYISDVKVTWYSARDRCKSMGQKLATILNKQQQENIEAALKKKGMNWNHHFWVGATDFEYGEFRWIDPPLLMTYTNWEKNEPNHGMVTPAHRNDEHCMELKNYHKWNDLHCFNMERFVCQTL